MGAIQAAGQPADVGPSLDRPLREVKVAARPCPSPCTAPVPGPGHPVGLGHPDIHLIVFPL